MAKGTRASSKNQQPNGEVAAAVSEDSSPGRPGGDTLGPPSGANGHSSGSPSSSTSQKSSNSTSKPPVTLESIPPVIAKMKLDDLEQRIKVAHEKLDLRRKDMSYLLQAYHHKKMQQELKANANSRGGIIQKLRQRLLQTELDSYRWKSSNAQLEAQLTKVKSKSKAMKMQQCQDHKDRATLIAKQIAWRVVKFIGCAEEEEHAVDLVYKNMSFDKTTHDEAYKESWKLTYRAHIKRILNQQRNSLTQELKKVIIKLQKAGKDLPSVDIVLQCALRTAPPEWLAWYWEECVGCVVGKTGNFSKKQKYYHLLSKVPADHDGSKYLLNASHEAMIVVVYENNFPKWKELVEGLKKDPNFKQDNAGGKWTTTDSGQNEYCAWDADGLQRYKDVLQLVQKDIKSNWQERLDKEKVVFEILRKQQGIKCDDSRAKKKRKLSEKRALKANKAIKETEKKRKVITIYTGEGEEDDLEF